MKKDSLAYKIIYKSPTPVLRILISVFLIYIVIPLLALVAIIETFIREFKDFIISLKYSEEKEFDTLKNALYIKKSKWREIWKGDKE